MISSWGDTCLFKWNMNWMRFSRSRLARLGNSFLPSFISISLALASFPSAMSQTYAHNGSSTKIVHSHNYGLVNQRNFCAYNHNKMDWVRIRLAYRHCWLGVAAAVVQHPGCFCVCMRESYIVLLLLMMVVLWRFFSLSHFTKIIM